MCSIDKKLTLKYLEHYSIVFLMALSTYYVKRNEDYLYACFMYFINQQNI